MHHEVGMIGCTQKYLLPRNSEMVEPGLFFLNFFNQHVKISASTSLTIN